MRRWRPGLLVSTRPERSEVGVTLRDLRGADLASWPETRLRVWARDVPIILIHSLPGDGLDAQARALYPRGRGYHTQEELTAVAHYTVAAQASASRRAWSALLAWSDSLYREYKFRTGKEHPGHMRTAWLAIACQPIHDKNQELPMEYSTADKIAIMFGDDGQNFYGLGGHIAVVAAERADHIWGTNGDGVYVMPDSSILWVSDAGWDVLTVEEGITSAAAEALRGSASVQCQSVSQTWVDGSGQPIAVLDCEGELYTSEGYAYAWSKL